MYDCDLWASVMLYLAQLLPPSSVDGSIRTFAKFMAPFRAPEKARVERKQDRANILGKLLLLGFQRMLRGDEWVSGVGIESQCLEI